MNLEFVERLRRAHVQPSAQRLAVAEYVLETDSHPSADEVWARVQRKLPVLSRATVYNTLNLFVKKGLLRELVLAPGKVVFDPKLEPHHHFVDDVTGAIEDVEWDAIDVADERKLRKLAERKGYDVREYMVVMRGRRIKRPPPRAGRKQGAESS